MNVQIRTPDVRIDQQTKDFMYKKLNKLSQFFDRIIDVTALAKEENVNGKDQKVVDIKIIVPGRVVIGSGQGDSFMTAVEKAVHTASRNLRRYKDKLRARS